MGTFAGAHGNDIEINNPVLGVPGFPSCKRVHPELNLSVEDATRDLICAQTSCPAGAVKIACVGDSITVGVRAHNGGYPGQLQNLLDETYGSDQFCVTNLGACSHTMQKNANLPYWNTSQYKALTSSTWDIVLIMLGTNDAKDAGTGAPSGQDNWHNDCSGGTGTHIENCNFAKDYQAMIDVVKTLGTTPVGPKIYTLIPPPLMKIGTYGMNITVINTVFPELIPLIENASDIEGTIDVFGGMGGVPDWMDEFPISGCDDPNVSVAAWAPCAWWCDESSCGGASAECHPNDSGYAHLAQVVLDGLKLAPSPMLTPALVGQESFATRDRAFASKWLTEGMIV